LIIALTIGDILDKTLAAKRAVELENCLAAIKHHRFCAADDSGLKNAEKRFLLLLTTINDEKPVMPSEAARKLGVTLAAITHKLNSLEEQGYIVRSISPTDRRSVYISLSEDGKKTVDKIKEEHRKNMYALIEYLGDEDSLTLIVLLDKITNYFNVMSQK
jgi:DNA-binding MarR family transcriptional regulator